MSRMKRNRVLCVSIRYSPGSGFPGDLQVTQRPSIHQKEIKVDNWDGPIEALIHGRLVADNKNGTEKLPEPYRAVHYLGNRQFLVLTTATGRGRVVDHFDGVKIAGEQPRQYTDVRLLIADPRDRAAQEIASFRILNKIRHEDREHRRQMLNAKYPLFAGTTFLKELS